MPPLKVDDKMLRTVCNNIARWMTQAVSLKFVQECESFNPGLYQGLSHSEDVLLKYVQSFVRERVRNACLET